MTNTRTALLVAGLILTALLTGCGGGGGGGGSSSPTPTPTPITTDTGAPPSPPPLAFARPHAASGGK